MATISKFYLHDAATGDTGTLPGSSSLASTSPTITATGASTNRSATETIGTSQTSVAATVTAGNPSVWYRRFLSAPIAAQTIAAQNLKTGWAVKESAAQTNYHLFGVWIWRPSTGAKVATLYEGNPGANGAQDVTQSSTEKWLSSTGTFTSTAGTAQNGDILVFELWRYPLGPTVSMTDTLYYDGTTEGSSSSAAAYIAFTNAITMYAASAPTLKVRRSSAWTAGVVEIRRSGAWVAPTSVKVRRGGAWTTVT